MGYEYMTQAEGHEMGKKHVKTLGWWMVAACFLEYMAVVQKWSTNATTVKYTMFIFILYHFVGFSHSHTHIVWTKEK